VKSKGVKWWSGGAMRGGGVRVEGKDREMRREVIGGGMSGCDEWL